MYRFVYQTSPGENTWQDHIILARVTSEIIYTASWDLKYVSRIRR